MANFDDEVMGLTGLTISGSSTAPSQTELSTFLTDGAREIVHMLPPDLKRKCTTISILNNSSPTIPAIIIGKPIFIRTIVDFRLNFIDGFSGNFIHIKREAIKFPMLVIIK